MQSVPLCGLWGSQGVSKHYPGACRVRLLCRNVGTCRPRGMGQRLSLQGGAACVLGSKL